ncbi:hypothetical protein P9112_004544 [Eukaryota sp. TZLM1-RC]
MAVVLGFIALLLMAALLAVFIVPGDKDEVKPFTGVQPTATSTTTSSNHPPVSSATQLPTFTSCTVRDDSEDDIQAPAAPSLRLPSSIPGEITDDESDDEFDFLPQSTLPSLRPSPAVVLPKLDLQNISHVPDQTDISARRRKDKLAFEHGKLSKITESLYVSGETPASDGQLLQSESITHVINLSPSSCDPQQFHHEFLTGYLSINIADDSSADIVSVSSITIPFIHNAIQTKGRVLVHCHQGVSRSCSVVISFLMFSLQLDYKAAYELVRESRTICHPNMSFECGLEKLWCRLSGREEVTFVEGKVGDGDDCLVMVDGQEGDLVYDPRLRTVTLNSNSQHVLRFAEMFEVYFGAKNREVVGDSIPSNSIDETGDNSLLQFYTFIPGSNSFSEVSNFSISDLDSDYIHILYLHKEKVILWVGDDARSDEQVVLRLFTDFIGLDLTKLNSEVVFEDAEPEDFWELFP